MKQFVYVEGMHCPACAARVTRVLQTHTGVESVEVRLEGGVVELTVRAPLTEGELREAIEAMGFDFLRVEEA